MRELLAVSIKAAIDASREVLKVYNQGFEVTLKQDNSPVTTGDILANNIITEYLTDHTSLPILSEENEKESQDVFSTWKKYWCIDPIDGTKEYVNKTGEYCISIGLLTPETSLLGVLAAPSLGFFYFAAEGLGSFKWEGKYEDLYSLLELENDKVLDLILENSISLSVKPQLKKYTFITSKSHFSQKDQEYYEMLKDKYSNKVDIVKMGSAIKIGLVVEGKANEYARLSSVNFWDIAGGHAIAKYAGLEIIDYYTQKPIEYKNIKDLKILGYTIKNI